MMQAEILKIKAQNGGLPAARVIAVSSGKGGVGKTSSVVNLAVALSRTGKKVLLFDADLGLGNVDIILGLTPKFNVGHLLRGEKTIEEVIIKGPSGIMILPASSGIQELTHLNSHERLAILSHLENLELPVDIMIIDAGAGISSNVLFFNMAAQEIIVVVTPEPTSITDAYTLMKVLLQKHGERRFRLLVNSAKSNKEGMEIYKRTSLAAERLLNISLDYIGCVLHDESVPKAVIRQKAVMELYPESKAGECYRKIANRIREEPFCGGIKGGMQFFWRQILNRT